MWNGNEKGGITLRWASSCRCMHTCCGEVEPILQRRPVVQPAVPPRPTFRPPHQAHRVEQFPKHDRRRQHGKHADEENAQPNCQRFVLGFHTSKLVFNAVLLHILHLNYLSRGSAVKWTRNYCSLLKPHVWLPVWDQHVSDPTWRVDQLDESVHSEENEEHGETSLVASAGC